MSDLAFTSVFVKARGDFGFDDIEITGAILITQPRPGALLVTVGAGPSSPAFDTIQAVVDMNANIVSSVTDNVTVTLASLSANRVLTMPAPAAVNKGQRWTFVDEDGSLGSGFTWTIAGNGLNINGLASFVLASTSIGASPGGAIGPKGSLSIRSDGTQYLVVEG